MQNEKKRRIIGRAELVDFPELDIAKVPARIDTGAKTAAVWASSIEKHPEGLSFVLFDKESELYTGRRHITAEYEDVVVASSHGSLQHRYKIKMLVKLKGKKVRASFTLANRSAQVYPVLIGRNVLLGKFIVDAKKSGATLHEQERKRSDELQARKEEIA